MFSRSRFLYCPSHPSLSLSLSQSPPLLLFCPLSLLTLSPPSTLSHTFSPSLAESCTMTHKLANPPSRPPNTHTHTCRHTRARTHTHTHTRARTHTHTCTGAQVRLHTYACDFCFDRSSLFFFVCRTRTPVDDVDQDISEIEETRSSAGTSYNVGE